MRSFVTFLGGAVSTGLVVAVLALAGVIDDDAAPSLTQAQAPPSPPAASNAKEPSSKSEDISDLYKRVASGVVFVQSGTGTGSGFVYDRDGHIVTNDHVVEGSGAFQVV